MNESRLLCSIEASNNFRAKEGFIKQFLVLINYSSGRSVVVFANPLQEEPFNIDLKELQQPKLQFDQRDWKNEHNPEKEGYRIIHPLHSSADDAHSPILHL